MLRLVITISLLSLGFVWGGWYGMLFFALCLAAVGVCMPPKRTEKPVETQETWEWEKVDRARRGSENDPTRPDEHPLLLTRTVRRR